MDDEPKNDKKHILLVDDDPAFRSYAVMLLARGGYRVSQACDGEEALQSVACFQKKGEVIDLLFTDLKMEGMSGLELILKLRRLGVEVPVLVATGYLDEVSFEELQQIKSHRFLLKPFKPGDLLLCVQQMMTT
jgi:CheY-like chemotaxis protein